MSFPSSLWIAFLAVFVLSVSARAEGPSMPCALSLESLENQMAPLFLPSYKLMKPWVESLHPNVETEQSVPTPKPSAAPDVRVDQFGTGAKGYVHLQIGKDGVSPVVEAGGGDLGGQHYAGFLDLVGAMRMHGFVELRPEEIELVHMQDVRIVKVVLTPQMDLKGFVQGGVRIRAQSTSTQPLVSTAVDPASAGFSIEARIKNMGQVRFFMEVGPEIGWGHDVPFLGPEVSTTFEFTY